MESRSARNRRLKRQRLLTYHGWSNLGIPNSEYRKLYGWPSRQSAKWNLAEERALLSQYKDGFSHKEIAEYHMRTVLAIQMRLERIGAR